MQLFGSKIKTNEKELTEFSDNRIFETKNLAELIMLSHGDSYMWNQRARAYKAVREEMQKTSLTKLYEKLKTTPTHVVGPFANDVVKDVLHFIETGEREFDTVFDIPRLIAEQERKRGEKRAAYVKAIQARERREAEARMKSEKKAKELAVAQSLGIRPEVLDKLQGS